MYRLDTGNAFSVSSPLIVAATGGGRWFRRSKAYVVGNFTLWVSPFGGPTGTGDSKIGGFTPGQLAASSASAPEIILDLSGTINPATTKLADVLVDNLGNVWVTSNTANTTGTICKFLLKDCLQSGSPSPSVVLGLTYPVDSEGFSSTFDHLGNLWTQVGAHGTFGQCVMWMFSPRNYAVSGSPNPDISLTIAPGGGLSTSLAEGMIFDGVGNMWVSVAFTNDTAGGGNNANGGIFMLTAAQLTASNAALVPTVYWHGTNFGGSNQAAVSELTIGQGALIWATDYPDNKIKAWDMRTPTSGNPAPVITLTSTTFNGPTGITFDTSGNLWVCNDNDSRVYRIPKASLGASGAVVPDIILSQTTILAFPNILTFPNNPDRSGAQPSGLPGAP